MPLAGIDTDPDRPGGTLHLWLYWAITVPLTIVVLIIYFTYVWWAERKRRNEDDTARKRFLRVDDDSLSKSEGEATGQESKDNPRFRLPYYIRRRL